MNLEAGKTVIGVVRAKNYNGTEEEVEIIYAGPENGYARYGNGELQKVKPEQYKLLLDEYIKEHNRKEEVEEILGGDDWDDDPVPIEPVKASQKNTRTFPSGMDEDNDEPEDGEEEEPEENRSGQFYAPEVRKKQELKKNGPAAEAKKESLKNNKAFRTMIIIVGVLVLITLVLLGIRLFAGKNGQAGSETQTQEQTESVPAEAETYGVAVLVGDIQAGKEITENDICLKEIDAGEYASISNRIYIDAEGNEFSSPVAMWDKAADIIGATANRNIPAGTVLTEKDFTVPAKEKNPVSIKATVTDEDGKTYEIDLGEYTIGAEQFKNLTENGGKEQLLDVIGSPKDKEESSAKSSAKEKQKETEAETTAAAETEPTAAADTQQAEAYYAPAEEPAPVRSAEPVEVIPYLEDVTEG